MTWSDLPHLVSLQLVQTLGAIGNSLLHNGPTIVVLVISGLAILGAVRLLTGAKLWHVAGFAGAYIAELLCWDFPVNERFLMPLAPLFLAGLVHESEYAYRMLQKAAPSRRQLIQRISLAFASAALASILVANGRAIFYSIPDVLTRHRTALHHRHAAYSWINRNLPKNSTFAAYHSTDLRLYSGGLAYRNVFLPRVYLTGDRPGIERTIAGLAEFARQHRLRYILCTDDDYEINGLLGNRALREKLFEKNRGLQRIYASPGVRIYQVGMPEAR